jgi:hypothetical protein
VSSGPKQYEGTVDLKSTDSQIAGLPATYMFTSGDAGSHVFMNVILKTAGTETITAADSAQSTVTGTSPGIDVIAAAANHFMVTTSFANPDVAGTPGSVTVTALDPYNNPVTSGLNLYEGTVDLTSSDGQAVGVPTSATIGASDAGSHTFVGVILKTAGTQTITATDSVHTTTTGSALVNVVAAQAMSLTVSSSFANPDIAGTPGTVDITAFDQYGNPAASGPNQYKGTINLACNDPQVAGLPLTYTFTTADAGTHTFKNVMLETVGTRTISATDSVNSKLSGSSSVINVVPAAADHFSVTTSFSNPDPAATLGTVTVTAKDHYGNTADSGSEEYLGTVALSSTDGQAAGLPASHTFTLGDAGSYTFDGVILYTAGTQTITARDSVNSTISGDAMVNVSALAATQLIFTTPPPATTNTGQPFTVVVSAEDPYHNVDPTFNGPVMLSLPNEPGFPMTLNAQQGVATFSGITLDSAANGETLSASGDGHTVMSKNPIRVMSPPAPTITLESVITSQKKNKKGKSIGKATLVGFQLDFSIAMNSTTTGSFANYQVTFETIKRVKKKTQTIFTPVPITALYSPVSNSVRLTISGKQAFAKGGQITVITGSPSGVTSAQNVPLSGTTIFTIQPKGTSVTPA